MQLRFLYFLLLFFFSITTQAQIREEIQLLVDSIAKNNRLAYGQDGMGNPSKQFIRFERLTAIATLQELFILTSHHNTVVKMYAMKAYCKRTNGNVWLMKPIFLQNLYDTTVITAIHGDFGIDNTVANHILNEVWCLNENDSIGFQLLRQSIDSLMLHDTVLFNKCYQKELLERIPSFLTNYNRIRQIALQQRSYSAVLALARYRKEEDVEIIYQCLTASPKEDVFYYGNTFYKAWIINEFPHPSFYPLLLKLFKKEYRKYRPRKYVFERWRILYHALAQYPTEQTMQLFQKTLNIKNEQKKYNLVYHLGVAINKRQLLQFNAIWAEIKKLNLHTDYTDVERLEF